MGLYAPSRDLAPPHELAEFVLPNSRVVVKVPKLEDVAAHFGFRSVSNLRRRFPDGFAQVVTEVGLEPPPSIGRQIAYFIPGEVPPPLIENIIGEVGAVALARAALDHLDTHQLEALQRAIAQKLHGQ